KKMAVLALAAFGAATSLIPVGSAFAGTGPVGPMTVAVYGDSPYGVTAYPPGGQAGDTAEKEATPAFISTINSDPTVQEVLHVGDIHSGKDSCTQAWDNTIAAYWQEFQKPLVYTPGDNEWTDCHKATSLTKPAEGGGFYSTDSPPVLNYIGTNGLTTNPAD